MNRDLPAMEPTCAWARSRRWKRSEEVGMMRRWAVGAMAGLAVLMLAVPAQAKGDATKVTVTNGGGSGGGGIGGPGPGGSGSNDSGSGGSGGGTAAAVLAAPIHLQ